MKATHRGGDKLGVTVIVTAAEVVLPPSASWATAVNEEIPGVDGDQDAEYGAVVSRLMSVESAKKSTDVLRER